MHTEIYLCSSSAYSSYSSFIEVPIVSIEGLMDVAVVDKIIHDDCR